ncbi:MAG TPA: metallophosphoesterase [Blastocatellia bacterium]|nr:metallophosphoesterase [Blastocatellia bacterium]
MRVFAIGDMHLEGGTGKTMDRFGDNWRNHDVKIFESWERLGRDDDLLLVVGDTSWAMRIEDALPDLERVGQMKGRKLLLKGNHDYWWQSPSKMSRALHPSIRVLNASSVVEGRTAIAGTRGWVCPDDSFFEEHDAKIYEREVGRLRAALQSLRGREGEFDSLVVALHYPPMNDKHEPSGFTELIDEYGADFCVFGHVHGEHIKSAFTGARGRTIYSLVSADAVDFTPAEIKTGERRRGA